MKRQQTTFELGLYMLAGKEGDSQTNSALAVNDHLNEILQAAKLADEAGLDAFGIGGYSRNDYAISTPAIALSHITSFIKLVSIAKKDPTRLFEEFGTLSRLSDGKMELIIKREAFIETFQALGYDAFKCEELLEEHLESLPISIKIEGDIEKDNIASAAQAGKIGAKLALAVLGGNPEQFKRLVDIYRKEAAAAKVPASQQQITVTGHMYLAESDALAKRQFYPYYRNHWREVHAQHGVSTDISLEQFQDMSSPDSALFVGSPELIVEKILQQHELYGHSRFLARIDVGHIPFKYVEKNIEYFAERVAPIIRKELSHH